MKLVPGIYESLITRERDPQLRTPPRVPNIDPLHAAAAPDLLAHHLYDAARRRRSALTGDDRLTAQLSLSTRLIGLLAAEHRDHVDAGDTVTPQVLSSSTTSRSAKDASHGV